MFARSHSLGISPVSRDCQGVISNKVKAHVDDIAEDLESHCCVDCKQNFAHIRRYSENN